MNSIQQLELYRIPKGWAFDDEEKGLKREPFVMGIEEMISELVPENIDKISIRFSVFELPKTSNTLSLSLGKLESESGGTWYKNLNPESKIKEGWLCPALFKYFDEAPEVLHATLHF